MAVPGKLVGSTVKQSTNPVRPIWTLGPVGRIHLLGAVGPGPVGPIHLLGAVGPGPCRGHSFVGPFWARALLGPFIYLGPVGPILRFFTNWFHMKDGELIGPPKLKSWRCTPF